MVTFETLGTRELPYGTNNFVEVAIKRAVDASRPDDPGVTFVSVSRGYTDQRGQRPYRMHFTAPPERELLAFLETCFHDLRAHVAHVQHQVDVRPALREPLLAEVVVRVHRSDLVRAIGPAR